VQIFLSNDLNHPPITEIYAKLKASGVFFEQTTTSGMYMFCLMRRKEAKVFQYATVGRKIDHSILAHL
jgi:hypothetical protein